MRNDAQLLSRTECSVLRGLAIIGIILHNYCHWLGPVVKENEYQYFQHNVDWFTQVLFHPDHLLPMHIVSFFGHYGVPIFLFLSAYGLVKKYEGISNPSRIPFVSYHFMKLLRMMIVGFVAFTMIDQMTPGAHHYHALDIIAQLGLFNNVLSDPDNIIWPGPYWFFGLMLQLYIVYRVFLYRKDWKWIVGAIVVCWLMQIFLDPEGETLNRVRYNFMGGMLPFGLGLLYAKYGRDLAYEHYALVAGFSLLLIIFCSYTYQTWFWVPVFICSFHISVVKFISKVNWLTKILEWTGAISAALFVCHPITRKIFIPISRHGDYYAGLLLYIVASICLAWVFREFMKRLPNPKMKQE